MNRYTFLLQSPILSQILPCVLMLFIQYYDNLTAVIFNSKHNKTQIQEDQISSDSYMALLQQCKKSKNFLVHCQSIRNWNCSICISENIWIEPFLLIFGNFTTHQQHEKQNHDSLPFKHYPDPRLAQWWGLAKYKIYSKLKDCMS